MKNNKNTVNTASKIIIPKKGVAEALQANKDKVLQDLESITTSQINIVGTNIECKKLMSRLDKDPYFQPSEEELYLLIDSGHYSVVSKIIDRINPKLHKKIAMKIINKVADDGLTYHRQYFENFKGLDSDVALLMIKRNLVEEFTTLILIDKFENLNKKVAIAYHEAKGEYLKPGYFGEGERKEISLYYINKGETELDLYNVPGDLAFAKEILKTKNEQKFEIICLNIEYFNKQDHKQIALEIIKNKWKDIGMYISGFKGLDKEVAFALVDNGIFRSNLSVFKKDDRKEIALYQLDHGFRPGIEYVNGLDLEFANKVIEKGFFEYLMENIRYFPASEHKAIALNVINAGYQLTHTDLRRTKGKDKELILTRIKHIEGKEAEKFTGKKKEQYIEIRKKFLCEYVANNPDEFEGLDDEIASLLIDLGYGKKVKAHKELYKDLSFLTKTRLLMQ